MDKISRKRRSENMSAIKSSGTKPELMVRAYLRNGAFNIDVMRGGYQEGQISLFKSGS